MNWRSPLFPKIRALAAVAAIFTGLLPIIGWSGGGIFWPLDLFNHFQLQYALALVVMAIVLIWIKSHRAAVATLVLLIIPLYRIMPTYVPPGLTTPGGTPVRVASFNVFVSNARYQDTLGWVKKEAPDFVYFTEVTETWASALEHLRDDYPHSIEEGTGFAFYSKLPIRSHEIIRCSDIEFPLLVARIETAHGDVTLLAVHPLPPVSRHWSNALDETMAALAREAKKTSGPVILAGDFNATRWSHKSKALHDAGLMDASNGKAPGATWMRSNPLLSIPIDRLLYRGDGMSCQRFEIGPDLGSDHRPLIAEFVW